MRFLIIAKDFSDALERRMACREDHVKCIDALKAKGHILHGGALLDSEETMMGSMVVVDFENEQELRDRWLSQEPYVTNKVWDKIDIYPYRVGPSFREDV